MADVLRSDERYGVVSLVMPEHLPTLNKENTIEKEVNGVKVWEIIGNINWCLIAVSASMIKNEIGGVPFLKSHPVYGHLEAALLNFMDRLGYKWCVIPELISDHTENNILLREWKNQIIFKIDEFGQITFDDFLVMKKNNLIG